MRRSDKVMRRSKEVKRRSDEQCDKVWVMIGRTGMSLCFYIIAEIRRP
jgi:hypothetical protein